VGLVVGAMRELWYPAATRDIGPPNKVSGPPSLKKGAVYHSMVGAFAAARARLFGSDTASWHFSVLKNGAVYQHYPVNAWAWHCGDRDDPAPEITNNRDLIGIEHEGGPPGNTSEPLTEAQLEASATLTSWLLAERHIGNLSRIGETRGLWEHREMYATACPSGRIPWARLVNLVTQTSEEDEMTDAERARLVALEASQKAQNAILVALKQQADFLGAALVQVANRPGVASVAEVGALKAQLAEHEARLDEAAAALAGD
jgi:N-acetyl-anhydromuramyl-L-alanine amidase AmpD